MKKRFARDPESGLLLPTRREVWLPKCAHPCELVGPGFFAPVGSGSTNDPNFSSVSLLLHGEGANNSTTITDSSSSPKTQTVAGNAKISTAQFKWGTASIAFDGSGDYVNVTTGATAFQFGTGDFTIEMWVRLAVTFPGTDFMMLYSSRYGGGSPACPELAIDQSTAKFQFRSSGSPILTGTTAPAANTWYHVAVSRSGTNLRLFVNGTQEGATTTDSNNYTVQNSGNPVTLGINTFNFSTGGFNGYLDDVRVTKGVARYTSNFTAPSAQFPDS